MAGRTTFARALKQVESGHQEAGYGQIGYGVRQSRLLGAYGIAADDWEAMSEYAGMKGARWQDPKAQDAVAKATIDALFAKYGDYRLVAVAWKAGEAVADAVAVDPKLLENEKLKPVASYVGQIMKMANTDVETNKPVAPDGTPITAEAFNTNPHTLKPSGGEDVRPGPRGTAESTLVGVLRAMQNRRMNQTAAEEEPIDSQESNLEQYAKKEVTPDGGG